MNNFEKILEISGDELVSLSQNYEKEWGKKLRLGHTKAQIDDMLGEGHGNLIPAAQYFQAIRELYSRANGMSDRECLAMEHQADLIEAKKEYNAAYSKWRFWNWFNFAKKLRVKAALKRAENSLNSALVSIRDLKQEMVDIHAKMKKVEPEVQAKYDCDIEKAQRDIWLSRLHYNAMKGERMDNSPISTEEKARIGVEYGRMDATIAMAVKAKYDAGWPKLEGPKDGSKVHRIPDRQREGMA